jgi:ribosomal protein S8
MNRGVSDILLKEGFLSSVMPGDERGPFVDILTTAQLREIPPESLLTDKQRERFKVIHRMQQTLAGLHAAVGSDGMQTVPLSEEQRQRIASLFESPAPPSANDGLLTSAHNGYMNSRSMLIDLRVLPAVSLVHLPKVSASNNKQQLSVQDLQYLTWPQDRRLWLDLRYDSQNQPALTHMSLISKGSRRVYTDPAELKDYFNGHEFINWKASEIGAVVIIHDAESGQLMSAKEALKRGVSGEVLCVAK